MFRRISKELGSKWNSLERKRNGRSRGKVQSRFEKLYLRRKSSARVKNTVRERWQRESILQHEKLYFRLKKKKEKKEEEEKGRKKGGGGKSGDVHTRPGYRAHGRLFAIDSASRIFRREKRRHDHNPRERHYARKPHRAARETSSRRSSTFFYTRWQSNVPFAPPVTCSRIILNNLSENHRENTSSGKDQSARRLARLERRESGCLNSSLRLTISPLLSWYATIVFQKKKKKRKKI